ncbi:MAG: hypothetical protein M3O06_07040 [Pseudomonadota bacterium]|nr:hypothetical protein [Pseudomonadota bacterium]
MKKTAVFVGTLLLAAPLYATTFVEQGAAAFESQKREFYNSVGTWSMCAPATCGITVTDWGADSMTLALYLRWLTTGDPSVVPMMAALADRQATYQPGSNQRSDVPLADSVVQSRAYAVTHDPKALGRAKAGFAYIDSWQASAFARGACPSISYREANGGNNHLKTLETDANYVKAALLLYSFTQDESYLDKAMMKYDAIRRYFLDPNVPLYTVYLFDDGKTCTQTPARFFASVNGTMIWNGYELYRQTHGTGYRDDAYATARAVQQHLADATGVYVNLQAENDVVEPLVEAMYTLSADANQDYATAWIVDNAAAMASGLHSNGIPPRLFNGPATNYSTATLWQANGGYALQYAAAKVAASHVASSGYWNPFISMTYGLTVTTTAQSFIFTGRAIALIGPIGEHCCETGHARVFIDGIETFDKTGIWQNKSAAGVVLPESVLFAWRWPSTGTHMITIAPGVRNDKEGGSYFHMTRYDFVP